MIRFCWQSSTNRDKDLFGGGIMNQICRYVAAWSMLLSLVLTSCASGRSNGSSDPNAERTCREGVCAQLDIAQPIVLNQPAEVTITINSTVDKSGLDITLVTNPVHVTFGPNSSWDFDAVVNQSQVFKTMVTFTAPGTYEIDAVVYLKGGGRLLANQKRVAIDEHGAVLNPTFNPHPTSDLFIPSTPLGPRK